MKRNQEKKKICKYSRGKIIPEIKLILGLTIPINFKWLLYGEIESSGNQNLYFLAIKGHNCNGYLSLNAVLISDISYVKICISLVLHVYQIQSETNFLGSFLLSQCTHVFVWKIKL